MLRVSVRATGLISAPESHRSLKADSSTPANALLKCVLAISPASEIFLKSGTPRDLTMLAACSISISAGSIFDTRRHIAGLNLAVRFPPESFTWDPLDLAGPVEVEERLHTELTDRLVHWLAVGDPLLSCTQQCGKRTGGYSDGEISYDGAVDCAKSDKWSWSWLWGGHFNLVSYPPNKSIT